MPVKQNPAYLPPVPVGAGKGGFLFVGGLGLNRPCGSARPW